MHEYSIAKNILDAVNDAAGGKKVNIIRLEIGELSDIPAHELIDTLKTLTKAKIEYKEYPSKVECECGFSGRAKILEKKHSATIYVCPKCSKIPQVLEGKDIIIKSIDVE